MTSSLRERSLHETRDRARERARELAITRVTDTTWLDYLGIPVFASIRPDATPGSLCVNAGKGVRALEAEVGAYMEAIEFATAEYRNRSVEVFTSTPHELADQDAAEFEFVDLCPVLGTRVDPDRPMMCVPAQDIVSKRTVAVPAELVFTPFAENTGQSIFGTSTNGLSSGNTVDEATVHGLAEVMERDVQAFNFFRDDSRIIDFDVLPADIATLVDRIEGAGLTAVARYTPNAFGLAYVQGFILEPSDEAPIAVSHGSGLHLVSSIATVRGLAEAAQSRLSYIHGGRDDLVDRFAFFATESADSELGAVATLRSRVTDQSDAINYSAVPDQYPPPDSIQAALATLVERVGRIGARQVLRVVLSAPGDDLAVVKVIVPRLESFQPGLKRVGPRLASLASPAGVPA
jgi:ribosomal protein S12 methylthiotransferase accessory factor